MRSDKSKELAQNIMGYAVAKCFEHHHDYTSVLTQLRRLVEIELNLAEVNDPDRDR